VIICAADDAYAIPLAVMLESLAAHTDTAQDIDVYIIDCGLSAPTRARIDTQMRPHVRFHWRPSNRLPELGTPRWGHVSAATFDRLLIQQYLPAGTSRALWLDCDLLVLGDVGQLFRLPMNGKTVLAARDPLVGTLGSAFGVQGWRELGLDANRPYFNAGVMLIDLDSWRALDVESRAVRHVLRHHKDLFFNEQEALNAILSDHWTPLEDRWNFSANRFHAKHQSPGPEGPAILHFAGRVKPWNLPDLGTEQELYFRFVDSTAWRGARPLPTLKNRLVSWYIASPLRGLTYPLENLYLRLSHLMGI
jgi:lipopolysaccharide biosynthesis glycosyltransferase